MVAWIKKAFASESTIRSATILLVVTLILSNILGMLRDHFLAGRISTYQLDTYYAAFKIPDLLFNVLILGSISSVFIPIFTEKISRKEDKRAFELASNILSAGLFFTILAAVILYFLLPSLIPLLVPRFSADRMQQTINLSRVLMLTPILFSISYTFSSILNSRKRFLAYSLAPLFYNLAIIFGTVFLSDRFGIVGVAWSVVVGAGLHFLVQLPSVRSLGFYFRPSAFWKDKDIKRIFYLMVPRSIGLGTNQITLLAFTTIASALAAGSIAVYTFADNIQTMPVVVFGTSLATVLFPTLSEQAALKDKENFLSYFTQALRAIIYTMLPTSVFMYLFSNQIIRLILGSGKFNILDTSRASNALAAFAFAILFESVLALIVRSFFAQKNTRIPMYASIVAMILSIGSGYLFSRSLGVAGLALGIALGNFLNVTYLLYFFNKKFIPLRLNTLSTFVFKVIFASAVAGLVSFISLKLTGDILNLRRFWGVFGQFTISGILGIGVYILLSVWLKMNELKFVFGKLTNRFHMTRGETLENIE